MAKAPKNGAQASDGFSRATIEMQGSAAFQSLTGSAIRLMLWFDFVRFLRLCDRPKGEKGNPSFTFTVGQAKAKLGMNRATFSRAKEELREKGFIAWEPGGLRGLDGVPSEHKFSDRWKDYVPPPKKVNDMEHVRAAKKNSCQVKQPRTVQVKQPRTVKLQNNEKTRV